LTKKPYDSLISIQAGFADPATYIKICNGYKKDTEKIDKQEEMGRERGGGKREKERERTIDGEGELERD